PGPEPPRDDRPVRPWWHPLRPVDQVTGAVRGLRRSLFRRPLARLSLAAPRTARFAARTLIGGRPAGAPRARLTPGLISQVVMDESIMALVVGPNRFPRREDYARVAAELAAADELFTARGWI